MMYRDAIDSLPQKVPILTLLGYGLLRLVGGNLRDVRDTIFLPVSSFPSIRFSNRNTKVDNYATRTISVDAFSHLQHLSLGFHLTRNTGAVLRYLDLIYFQSNIELWIEERMQ